VRRQAVRRVAEVVAVFEVVVVVEAMASRHEAEALVAQV